MAGMRGKRLRAGVGSLRVSGLVGVIGRNRSPLLACTALTAFMAMGLVSPVSVQQAAAANECGTAGGGVATISCGSGPYTSGIVYGNAQTNAPTSMIFNFDNTQAGGPNSGNNRSAVQLSTNKANNSFDINIDQVGNGDAPSFLGRNVSNSSIFDFASKTSNGFQVNTSASGASITFDVNQQFDVNGINGSGASFTGGTATSLGVGNASASGIAFGTTGANSGVIVNVANMGAQGGTATALGLGSGTAHGFGLSTSGTNSGIVFNATNSFFGGGSANGLSGNASGVSLSTSGATSAVLVDLTDVEIEGGSVLALGGSAHGFNVATQGDDSRVEFTLTGGSIGGGSVNALSGEAHGVNIETGGENSGVTFDLVEGSINGGSGISVGHGANIATYGAGSHITFDTAEGTTISSSNGHGVNLYTDGSDIYAQNTIDGLIESTWEDPILGTGIGTGFNAVADGTGNVFAHVGATGEVRGSGAGLVGQAGGTGDVVLNIDGTVSQTYASATSGVAAFGLLPVGVGGVAYGSGDVTITAIEGSTISQAGSTPLVEVKGVGMFAVNAGTGNATATADGILSATGIGAASMAGSGNATTNVGGSITVGGGTGVSPLGALTGGALDETVGALAVSGTGAAQVNIFGGDIAGLGVLSEMPGIGGVAVVLGGNQDAGVDVGNGIAQSSIINAQSVGLGAINFGTGDANIDLSDVDPEGDFNIVNSNGIGIMAIALGGGDADIEARNSIIASSDTGILAVGNNVWIDANDVTAFNGAGIAAFGANVDVDLHGDVFSEGDFLSAGVTGISTGNFSVEIDSNASISTDGGLSGNAIVAASGTGISVINDGTITGTMNLFSAAGNNYVENNSNNSWNWAGFNTFVAAGGDNIFENNGTSTAGPLSLTTFISSGDSIINNNFGATFNTEGFNAFAFATGGTSQFNNAGTFNVDGFAGFFGLEDFNNYNTVDMTDGAPFDVMATTGNFNGYGNSTLSIDAELTPGGFADLLIVGGDVTGETSLTVNDLIGGPGQYTGNDDAILFALVGGNTDTTNFTTNGGIEKGFFTYDAYLRDTPVNGLGLEEWVLASAQNHRSFELPVAAFGAQQMWHTSTGTWTDRTADLRSAFGGTGFGGGGADAIVEPLAPAMEAASVTPGIWGRLFGSTQSRDFSNSVSAPTGLSGPESSYNNNFDQKIYGGMVGIDFGKESLTDQGNQAWLFGVMGGYTGSKLSFDDSDTDVDYKAGSIGAYITYLNGGFFVDATLKADFGKMDYKSGGDSGSADFTSVGGVIDAGYRMTMASGWYFEPKATLTYVNTDFDNLDVLGQEIAFSDGESLRGRLGGRVGTAFDHNGMSIEPYVEASVWNEFKGDYTAAFTSNGTDFTPGFNAEGVYGEVALGASFINTSNGWSGFAKGATQFGEDSTLGFTGNLGVRKNF